jgi:hypothetical protein
MALTANNLHSPTIRCLLHINGLLPKQSDNSPLMDCSRFNTLTIFCPAMHIPMSISRYLYVDIGIGKVVFFIKIYIMYGIGIVIGIGKGSLEQIWGVILWQRGHLSSQDSLFFCSPYSFQKSWLSCSGPLAVPIMNR